MSSVDSCEQKETSRNSNFLHCLNNLVKETKKQPFQLKGISITRVCIIIVEILQSWPIFSGTDTKIAFAVHVSVLDIYKSITSCHKLGGAVIANLWKLPPP